MSETGWISKSYNSSTTASRGMQIECVTAFNRDAEEYDRWYHKEPGSIIFESEAAAIETLLPDGLGVEVGVGTGVFSSRLRIPVGIDPALNMIRLSKKRGIEAVLGMCESLPIRSECLDYVLLVFTICFLGDPVQSFREMGRALKERGSLILSFIPRDSSWGKLYEEKKAQDHPLYRYARFYTLEEVRRMLHRSGFRVTGGRATLRQPPLAVKEVEDPSDVLEPDSQYGLICLKATKAQS